MKKMFGDDVCSVTLRRVLILIYAFLVLIIKAGHGHTSDKNYSYKYISGFLSEMFEMIQGYTFSRNYRLRQTIPSYETYMHNHTLRFLHSL